MIDLAAHVRIFEKHPDDDFVSKRSAATNEVGTSISKIHHVQSVIGLCQGLAEGTINGGVVTGKLAELTITALKKKSSAFVSDGRQMEINTIALAAIGNRLAAAGGASVPLPTNDLLAMAVWSALSLQGSHTNDRFESLRLEVLNLARHRVKEVATKARMRKPVPEPKTPQKETDAPLLPTELAPALSATISALRENAVLDREEIDLLWWTLSGWSEILEKPYSDLTPAQAAIAASLEVAHQTRRVPSDAHKHLALRMVKGANKKFRLSELIEALGSDRQKMLACIGYKEQILEAPAVFPLLFALESGTGGQNDNVILALEDWCARALLEGSILYLANQ
ncbi:MAG: hypothetical protein JSR78_07390 [Proteobacteria bacterium]|nr:hypothetical protein [Pseudomonadota bacterium]